MLLLMSVAAYKDSFELRVDNSGIIQNPSDYPVTLYNLIESARHFCQRFLMFKNWLVTWLVDTMAILVHDNKWAFNIFENIINYSKILK